MPRQIVLPRLQEANVSTSAEYDNENKRMKWSIKHFYTRQNSCEKVHNSQKFWAVPWEKYRIHLFACIRAKIVHTWSAKKSGVARVLSLIIFQIFISFAFELARLIHCETKNFPFSIEWTDSSGDWHESHVYFTFTTTNLTRFHQSTTRYRGSRKKM